MRNREFHEELYRDRIKDMTKESALQYVEERIWSIEMADRLTQEDFDTLDVLYKIKKELSD